jgi:hypothetical protein
LSCAYSHFDLKGTPLAGDIAVEEGGETPSVNGWVTAGASFSDYDYGLKLISADWTVPPAPARVGSQIIYFFPGFEPASNSRILQPVLGWNGADGHGTRWVAYSWNCCVAGTVQHSTPIDVSPSDSISGTVAGDNCDTSTGVCADWTIDTSLHTPSGLLTTTLITDSGGEALTWALGGVLEAYNVAECDHYPNSSSLTFSNIVVTNVWGGQAVSAWANDNWSTSPDCGTSTSSASTSNATLHWDVDHDLTLSGCLPGQICCEEGHGRCALCAKFSCPR